MMRLRWISMSRHGYYRVSLGTCKATVYKLNEMSWLVEVFFLVGDRWAKFSRKSDSLSKLAAMAEARRLLKLVEDHVTCD